MKALSNFFIKIKQKVLTLVMLGTIGTPSSSENRITIFCNLLALLSTLAAFGTLFQLLNWGIEEPKYLLFYFTIPATAVAILYLNSRGRFFLARIVGAMIINVAAWNALIFYGKSFNGYLLFYAAIVYSVMAFKSKTSKAMWYTLAFPVLSLIASDYLSHNNILPITGFHSLQAPTAVLWSDSIIVSILIISMLLIEKLLAEKNEQELKLLNQNLESIVQKRTELLNIARAEALQASQAKSQFVANTSHELRTPLGAIIGFIDLISNNHATEEEKSQYLEVVRRNSNQLLQIVNEVLDLSKIEAQKLQLENETVNLHELMEDVRLLMSLKAEDKGLFFTINEQTTLPKKIYTDPLRLKQILVNLIGNAIKFTEFGEVEVTIKTENKNNKDYLVFDIKDTGPGIDTESAKTLFQPFSQGDNTYMRKFGGTGLGLSLSKSLAHLLGGELKLLCSQIGKGSTFRLTIESVVKDIHLDEMGHGKSKSHTSMPNLSNKKILVVDDSPDNQFLISRYLTQVGAIVDIAKNGAEALNKTKNPNAYNVILMDLQMPVMDGYEATRIIKNRGCMVPIVAFTAHAMKEEMHRSKAAGFVGYLTKPVDKVKLITTLNNLSL